MSSVYKGIHVCSFDCLILNIYKNTFPFANNRGLPEDNTQGNSLQVDKAFLTWGKDKVSFVV